MDLGADAILISANLGAEKPAPEFFAAVAAAAGCAPGEIVYVGDRLDNDVLPARRAGLRTVLLRRGPWGYLHAERARRRARRHRHRLAAGAPVSALTAATASGA